MNIFQNAWREAEATFDRLNRELQRRLDRAARAKLPPDVVAVSVERVGTKASVLIEAAFSCFRSPPSGAALQYFRFEERPGSWTCGVRIVYGPLAPERSKAEILRELGPCTRCGSRAHWVGEDGSSFNGACRRGPERLP